MKIYTRTGDSGTSSLYDGSRTGKESPYFELLGEVDELSSRIGVLCTILREDVDVTVQHLRTIQQTLQDMNSHIATPNKDGKKLPVFGNIVKELEDDIDRMEAIFPKLTKFILPGTFMEDAQAHMCRTQVRTVERAMWYMVRHRGLELPDVLYQYVNRLSDYFFVLARWYSH